MLRSTLRIHLQAQRLTFRQYARASRPSSLSSLRKELYVLTPRSLFAIYRKWCPNPSLIHIPDTPFSFLGQHNHDSSSQVDSSEYNQWAHIARAPTLASALDHVNHVFSLAPALSQPSSPVVLLPAWLLLSVLSKPPTTRTETLAATTLVLHQPHTPRELSALVLLLSAYWLANLRMYAPLRTVVLRLANYKLGLQAFHVVLMLRILAQVRPASQLQPMIALLLDLATRKHFDLGVRTYRTILENRAATGLIASLVERHMRACGYSPNLSHSRAFVRIYGRAGRRKVASKYWRRIRLGEYHGPKADYVSDTRHQVLLLEETLRGAKRPKQVNKYINYLLNNAARGEGDPSIRQSGRLPTLPGPVGIPKKVFMLALRTSANDVVTPSRQLLNIFRSGMDSIGNGTKRLWCYFVTIKGLLKRHEYDEAASLLGEIWDETDKFSTPEVTIAVETLTMIGRPDSALRLLLSLVPECGTAKEADGQVEGESNVLTSKTYVPTGRIIDTQAVNSYMTSLLRIGRLDAVFVIWDVMSHIFRVEPDSVTLAVLLKAARYARKTEGALHVAIADFGLGRVLSGRAYQDWTKFGRREALEALEALLAADGKSTETAFWRGERAGVVALRIAWEVLTENWPELKQFNPPCYAIRRSADAQAVSPMSDLLRSFSSCPGNDTPAAEDQDADRGHPYQAGQRMYFEIVPEDAAFRALFDLLAEEDRASQIPLVLTWMRYLKVHPSRDTLATALIYWGEVTFEGPWIRRLRGGESQYIKLLKWITRWVGREKVPKRDTMQKALMRVKRFRELDVSNLRRKVITTDC